VIIAIVICIVIVSAVYAGYTQFFNSEKNTLKIISIELIKSEGGLNFTVIAKIQNTGSNDINNAELNFIFIKNNDILNSKTQSLYLKRNGESTYSVNFIDVAFETGSTYKVITTIYLENELLDTKTIAKQF
jgi:hypothetical protein